MDRAGTARATVLALLFASAMWTSLPDLAGLARDSFTLLGVPYEARRERVLGPDVVLARGLLVRVPERTPVAIVLRHPRDIDRAVFVNAALYPRPTRIYQNATSYWIDAKHAATIVLVDGDFTPPIRLVSAEELR